MDRSQDCRPDSKNERCCPDPAVKPGTRSLSRIWLFAKYGLEEPQPATRQNQISANDDKGRPERPPQPIIYGFSKFGVLEGPVPDGVAQHDDAGTDEISKRDPHAPPGH